MKATVITAPGETQVVDVPKPTVGPNDVLVRMRACGVCGSDGLYISMGGLGKRHMPLGHEPAGEIVEIGSAVTGLTIGDHVVVNPMVAPSGIIGNGGPSGALAEYLLIEDAVRGKSLEVVPDHIPFEVAALNEPMAVARHGVNRCEPKPSDKVVIFGAGPIGLGATIGFKSAGVSHVVVADLIPARLEKALAVGADAVINSADEDVAARLVELHGSGESMFPGKAGTDIYFDAAGAPAVINAALGAAKTGARLVRRRGAQGTRGRRLPQRHEQRDHHRRIDRLPGRDLRSHQGPHRELGEIRRDRQPHNPVRRRRRGTEDGVHPRGGRQGRCRFQVTFN